MKKRILLIVISLFSVHFSLLAEGNSAQNVVNLNLDDLWVLVAAALVFFMQAGFKVLETGLVKAEHRAGIGAKNLLDWVAGSIAFFMVGFAIMFGGSIDGFIGSNFFLGEGIDTGKEFIFFLFQLAFAGTALTIVSGAMSGRTGVIPYFIASLMTATIIYPVFGHWAWGNLLLEDNEPWLASLGFMDFAGSTVVHSVGAWVAIVGIVMVGPRIGRYDAQGNLQAMKASDYSYSILGVMILWLGWWGFNGGSTLAFNDDVAKIILNTNLAGAAACFSAYFHAVFFQKKKDVIEKIAGGSLTGLVAITACCNVVTPISSLMIGFMAGIIHNLFFVFLSEKLKLDDPVGAIAVHGIGGVFGTLCVAFFGEADLLVHSRGWQLVVQLIGIVACFLFTTSIAAIVFYTIKKTMGLRVSPMEEIHGAFVDNLTSDQAISDLDKKTVAQIAVKMSKRGYNMYTVSEYLKIDQAFRKKLIDEDRVKYMDDKGQMMSPLVAVRQLSLQLESEKNALSEEHEKIKSKQAESDKSIQHAGRLQSALLGSTDQFQELFEKSFILFQPKSKVSGDFYWYKKMGGYKIVLVANANISGVSGGFLGMLGLSIIREIYGAGKNYDPDTFLNILDQKFAHALRVKSLGMKLMDSLDISIVVVDEMKQKIHFAGANNGICLFNKGILKTYEGTQCSIGLKDLSKVEKFKKEIIPYTADDTLYMFTDGYYQQANKHGATLSKDEFIDQLDGMQNEVIEHQKMLLEVDFDRWTKECEQTDDVLIIGMKLR